jgi:hypothetical protein
MDNVKAGLNRVGKWLGALFILRPYTRVSLLLVVVSLVTIIPQVRSWNDASRMATIQAIVENGTLQIDDSVFVDTGDKVYIDGHFYSSKPIFPSAFGALVYAPLSALGVKLSFGWNLAYYLIALFTIKLFWLLGLKAFYCILRVTDLPERHRLTLTLALAFASIYFSWSSTFNNHLLAAAHLIIGFYFYLQARQGQQIRRNLLLAGLFISLAGAEEHSDMLFYAGFFALIVFDSRLRKHVWLYMFPLAVTLLPTLLVYYQLTGNVLPLISHQEYYQYPGSPWLSDAEQLSGQTLNRGWFWLQYIFNGLLGTHGFILYNPLLFLAIPYLVREVITRRKLWREALVIGAVATVIAAYYLSVSVDFGGSSYSLRWFVVFLPVMFIFLYPVFSAEERVQKWFKRLRLAGIVFAVVGFINPWSIAEVSNIPFVSNIIELFAYLHFWLFS